MNLKKSKKIMALIIASTLVLTLGSCVKKEEKRPTDQVVVTMAKEAEPEGGFDPTKGWGDGEHAHEPLVESTLTTTDADLKVKNDLATEVNPNEDGSLWTVKIRKDVKFSNGNPLSAKDVAYTYNQCKKNNHLMDFSMLKEAVATDDDTVEFRMNGPFGPWPYIMAEVGIIDSTGAKDDFGNPIGSGRYVIKQWVKGEKVVLEANKSYYGEEPKIKKVTVLFMDEDASLAAVKVNKADVAYTNPQSAKNVKVGGYNVLVAKSVDCRCFNLPTIPKTEKDGVVYGNDVLADVNVRRAITYGVDRDRVVNEVLNGYGTPGYSPCDNMPWSNKETVVAYNKEKAEKILDEAGWKKGKDGIREKNGLRAEFEVGYNPKDSVRQALSENFADQMAEIGIKVNPKGIDWDQCFTISQSQPVAFGWGSQDPMVLNTVYHKAKNNPLGMAEISPYNNPTVDSLQDKALSTVNLDEANKLWSQSQWNGETGVTVEGDAPWLWLCNIDHLFYVKDNLKVAKQKLHPHGHGWTILNNVDQWSWEDEK